MLLPTQGIVLRSVKYSETSLICDIYTQSWGLRTYIFNGVRQAKSNIPQLLLRPNALVDLVVYHAPEKEINRVREIRPAYVYTQVPFGVVHGAVATFMVELLQKTLKEHEGNESIFRFILDSFICLDGCTPAQLANFHLLFMVHLTAFLGFAPNVETYTENAFFDYKNGIFATTIPNHLYFFDSLYSQYLVDLACTPLHQSQNLQIPKADRNELIEQLSDFYSFHTPNFEGLQSYKIFQMVF